MPTKCAQWSAASETPDSLRVHNKPRVAGHSAAFHGAASALIRSVRVSEYPEGPQRRSPRLPRVEAVAFRVRAVAAASIGSARSARVAPPQTARPLLESGPSRKEPSFTVVRWSALRDQSEPLWLLAWCRRSPQAPGRTLVLVSGLRPNTEDERGDRTLSWPVER